MLGRRVQVYFNLHKKVYSVRCKKTRLVIAHLSDVSLENVEFKVSESGRQRVLKEKRKNVHAIVEGNITCPLIASRADIGVTYNPYLYTSFVTREIKIPVRKANIASLKLNGTIPVMRVA